MKSESPTEFYEYKDAELSMRVPSYLRDRKGNRVFEAKSKVNKLHPLFFFGIELQEEDTAKVFRELTMRTIPGFTDEQQGIVRRGRASYLADGIEKLASAEYYDVGDGHLSCSYDVFFALNGHHIYVTFLGHNDLRAFEDLCKRIVSSIRLVKADESRPGPRRTRMAGGLRSEETRRLKQALDDLSPEIAYLRRPILAIAKEDQDLLGSGEGDISSIAKAIEKLRRSEATNIDIATHADMLRKWLLALPDHDRPWAAPAWFVEGFLRGYELFEGV